MRPCPQARWGRWTSGRCDDSPRFDGVWTWVLVSNIAEELRKADEGAPEVIEIRANRVIKNASPEDRRRQNSTYWSKFPATEIGSQPKCVAGRSRFRCRPFGGNRA